MRGRPRSDASREAILEAARALLAEKGSAGMAIEAVAQRAGVGKATIYRWWTEKQDLAVEAFFEGSRTELAFPDTGSAREDFRRQVHQVAALLRGPSDAALAGMIAGARMDEKLSLALRERWVLPRMRWGSDRLATAIAGGACVEGLDPSAALTVLYGSIYAQLLFGLPTPSEAQVEAHLRVALSGIFK